MMGRKNRVQGKLFYEFRLEDRVPQDHLLRRMNVFVTAAFDDLHAVLKPHYSDIGRPSIDPELMIRMPIVGYCYGIRSERWLCQEIDLNLAYRWFCKLDLDDAIPHHSTSSVNRLGRFRDGDILLHLFERVVASAMVLGLVNGEGFAVDGSVLEANTSRYHGVAPDEIAWTDKQRAKRADGTFTRSEFQFDKKKNLYVCPAGTKMTTTGRIHCDGGIRYLASVLDCRACPLKEACCPNMPGRRIVREINEDARDVARRKMTTKAFLKSRNERKKVEMRFGHLKTHHGFERLRLRGLSGAQDEFLLAAIVQNLKTTALKLLRPLPGPA